MDLIKKWLRDFIQDDCPSMAAALAYYTVFALPSLLFVLVMLVGQLVEPRIVQERLVAEFGGLIGAENAGAIEEMVVSASDRTKGGVFKVLLGIGGLLLGATGAFMQLQKALNRAWEVEPDGTQGGVRNFLLKRVMSFGFILVVGFLLLVSLAVSALLAGLGDYLGNMLGGVSEVLLQVIQMVVSLVVIGALFTLILKVLPDAVTSWNDSLMGGAVTAGLFVLGKFAIGLYIGRSNPGTAFGAAGALAVLLIWIYYTAMIVLAGAEFTQTWAQRKGEGIMPEKGARRLIERPR